MTGIQRFLVGACLSAVVLFGVVGSAQAAHKYEAISPGNFSGAHLGGHGLLPNQVFKFGSIKVECEQIKVTGTLPTPGPIVKMVPSYNFCTSSLTTLATISTTRHCAYELFEPVPGGIEYLAEMAIVNSSGGTCELEFNTNSHISCVLIVQATIKLPTDELKEIAPFSVQLVFKFKEKISYTHTGTGCTGIGNGSDASYEGETNVENIRVV